MSSPSPSGARREIDQVCDRFEAEWRAGNGPRIENYLGRLGPQHRADLLRALLDLELEYRLRRGERPGPAEYLRRFPGDAAVVGAALAQPAPPAAGPPPQATGPACLLTVTEGPHKGQTFSFRDHDVFLVGRSRRAHLAVTQDRYASRNHFLLEINLPACRLTDLGSRTGTFVNGRREQVCDLRSGDAIRAGHTTLVVSLPAAPGQAGADDEAPTLAPGAVGPAADAPPRPAAETQKPPAAGIETVCPADAGAPVDVPDPTWPAITGYRIKRELGRGGMGVVYLAAREADGSSVALKTVTPAVTVGGQYVQRFLREVDILRQLDHKHIVRLIDSGGSAGLLYFAMEYVEGIDAKEMLRRQGPLPVRTAVGMLCQLLLALEYAHDPRRKFVHRDIKPANLLVTVKDGGAAVKLADFGLARVYQASRMSGLTMKGDVGGTGPFMPPEQITEFREVRGAADQYSAAATLYNLLTGCYLYGDGTIRSQTLTHVLQEEPVPIGRRRPDLPAGLAEVIHRALHKEAKGRFPNVHAFRAALTPFAQPGG
jgi:serine/threonine-protein kinase